MYPTLWLSSIPKYLHDFLKSSLLQSFSNVIITIIIIMPLVTGPFFLVLFLNQRWTPSLRFQVSHCSTFRSMCDVPSIAVFCKKSIECVPGIACRFFCKLCVTIPVAPIITGMIVHFRFRIRSISMPNLLYLSFFSTSFCTTFRSAGIATSISVHVSCFLFLIIISALFAVTSLSVYCLTPQRCNVSFIHRFGHVCVPCVCCFSVIIIIIIIIT